MLNSAYGAWLPRSVEPPITTISRSPPARPGCRSRAVATFVSGPTAISVTGSRHSATTDAMSSSAGRGSSGTSASGSAGPSSALSPWTCAAVSSARCSGRSAPAAIGTSRMPASVQTRRAFSVTLSSVPLPATVVIARRSSAGLAAASSIATASSWPGSQSRTHGTATTSVLERDDLRVDLDRPVRDDVGAEAAAVHERPQRARRGQPLEVRARLARPLADALDVADAKASPDQRVEVDPTRHDVAPGVRVGDPIARGQHEGVEDLGGDQRQVVAARGGVRERAGAVPVAVAL